MRRLTVLLLLVAVAGCGSDSETKAKPKASATAQAQASATPTGCQKVAAPKPKPDGGQSKPTAKLDMKKTYTAVVKTSCGAFSMVLDVKRAPKTTASFVSLARKGFFDDQTFHRVSPGFVIQGGDPTGTGTGGPGYSVVEPPPADERYPVGTVAMAKSGQEAAGTSGSQFFVVTGDASALTPDYALLGKVTKGDDAVEAIATTGTDPSTERPLNPVVIDSVTITES